MNAVLDLYALDLRNLEHTPTSLSVKVCTEPVGDDEEVCILGLELEICGLEGLSIVSNECLDLCVWTASQRTGLISCQFLQLGRRRFRIRLQ